MARHGGPPLGSAAREATASPYVGLHRTQELERRMLAAGMIWDDARQDWIPDPAIWGEPDDPPRCTSCGHLTADECGCCCCTWTCDERPANV